MMDEELQKPFERLVKNREALSLRTLQTVYRKNYDALVEEVRTQADRWANSFLAELSPPVQIGEQSEALLAYYKAISDDIDASLRPGGIRSRYRAALIDRLDMDEFGLICEEWLAHQWKLWTPYFHTHCLRKKDGAIYCDLIDCRWDHKHKRWLHPDGLEDLRPYLPPPPKETESETEQLKIM